MTTQHSDLDAELGAPIPGDEVSFVELLEAATSPPNKLLLRRYSDAVLASRGDVMEPHEVQWIEANLASNPAWQSEWARLQEEYKDRAFGRLLRHLMVAASLLVVIGVGWFGAARQVHVTVVVATSSPTRSTSIDNRPPNERVSLIADGRIRTAWQLIPPQAPPNADTRLAKMKSRFEAASDRFMRSTLAFDIARLNELQGRYAASYAWYDACWAQGTDDVESAGAGIRRTERRHSR